MNALKNMRENAGLSLPEVYLEMHVLPGRLTLSLKKGADVTGQLEEEMRQCGLQCSIEYKSPCG